MANDVTYIQSPFNKSRKDKFLMVLTLPRVLREMTSKYERSEHSIMLDTLQFSVFGAITPTIEIPAINTRYSGQTLAHSSHSRTTYEPNTVSFTIDNRFNNYWVIYKWLDLLNKDTTGGYDSDGRTTKGPNLDYRANISVFALDEYNKKVAEFVYTDCFPTALGGIEYNYRNGEEIESSFTYSYSQFIIRPVLSDVESL